jgi:pimeloyl-ACP methyl ester carboxylesterase
MTSQRPLMSRVSARDAWRASALVLGVLFAVQAFVWASPAAADSLTASDVYAAPQRLVAVDGARRLNLYCVGSGSPTVILDAGSGASMATWRHVQAEIGQTTHVCAYDRAGLGFSDAAERPSDLRNIVDDLRRLVKAAPIAAPFVYVGHSLAGAIGLLYVATYPDDIAGAVMVEPAFAGEVAALEAPLPPDKRNVIADAFRLRLAFDDACLALARQGALASPAAVEARACVDISGNPDALDDALRQVTVHLQTLPRVWEAQRSELASFTPERNEPDVNTRELDDVHPSFDDKPLIVLSRGVEEGAPGVPPAYLPKVEAAWRAGHDRIAALSSRGANTIVPGARHYVQIDRPEAVVDAVRLVVEATRSR